MSTLNGLRINVCCFVYPCYTFRKFEYVLCKYTPRFVVIGSEKYNFPIDVSVRYISWLYVKVWLLTYLLTPWSRVLLEKLASLQLVKNLPQLITQTFCSSSQLLFIVVHNSAARRCDCM